MPLILVLRLVLSLVLLWLTVLTVLTGFLVAILSFSLSPFSISCFDHLLTVLALLDRGSGHDLVRFKVLWFWTMGSFGFFFLCYILTSNAITRHVLLYR